MILWNGLGTFRRSTPIGVPFQRNSSELVANGALSCWVTISQIRKIFEIRIPSRSVSLFCPRQLAAFAKTFQASEGLRHVRATEPDPEVIASVLEARAGQ